MADLSFQVKNLEAVEMLKQKLKWLHWNFYASSLLHATCVFNESWNCFDQNRIKTESAAEVFYRIFIFFFVSQVISVNHMRSYYTQQKKTNVCCSDYIGFIFQSLRWNIEHQCILHWNNEITRKNVEKKKSSPARFVQIYAE